MARQQGSQPSHVDTEGRLAEAILSASSGLHWVLDRERRCRYVSPYAASLFQLDPTAVLGRPCRELGLPAELMGAFEKDLCGVFQGSGTVTGEIALAVCDERRHFEYILTPLETAEDRVGLVIANAWDVTERVRLEESLHRSEHFFRGLMACAPDAILLVDAAGTITLANEQAETLFGFAQSDLIGMRVETLLPAPLRAEHVGLREAYQARPVTRPMGAGCELYARRNNGVEVPVEISLSSLETPDGEFTISIIRDVTERKRDAEQFQAVLEAAPDCIMVVDAGGVITLANGRSERLFGYSRSELIGMPVEQLIPRRYRARHVKLRIHYQKQPETRPMGLDRELYGQRKDGSEFPVGIGLSPLQTPEGVVTVIIIQDITVRIATAKQIRKLNRTLRRKVTELAAVNKELEAFSYSVSHDLRAPLRGLDGFSQALLEDYAGQLDETGQSYLERIRAASQRMARLIDDLLRLSRITRAEMTIETVDLTGIASEIVKECQKREPHRQVAVHIAPDLTVEGDRRLLRVALENLLSNAWKFTAQAPRAEIELGIDTVSQTVPVYYVRDNGAGFDMAYAERLFGPFQRLHSMQEFEGNGIGLATVHRIIQRHGGCIWADAEPQRGTTFYFRLAAPDSLSKNRLTQGES